MKEDVLETIGADWLLQKPSVYVKTNLKYRPPKESIDFDIQKDNIYSDIDILSLNINNLDIVTILNCKSWMDGFDCKKFDEMLKDSSNHEKEFGGKEYWKHFRELISPKWNKGFIQRIKEENKNFKNIKYIILSLYAKNKESILEWQKNQIILQNFKNENINLLSIEILELKDLIKDINIKSSDYVENSDFIRMIQILKASRILN
ncbi:hypothetical protein LEP1GSC202_0317 [Leptospira yanagawae serovar Saopaulo str. Sao Paulo = ATCC 700523]|uniref:Uncharacterized protein n=1 Tax=Leptospira yanagawae serovar Saopaulo str. Sao Paulo = ATCC 700523 TaxID=1249483 RepID=A0A5E8H8R8_9LEPT|nr:hypothetical protein [Leptospira yanagawae]EOQ87579.1 hypothetical protein LEP1GSC202_0317 [Leptospira yanagawae serovar Saopaulo str. Sao Paulo = ATCC 700523]